jgi:predicted dehydrogenase
MPSRQSRRDFLVQSSAIAGTTLASTLVTPGGVHAGGDDGLKIGLMGCGGRGAGAVRNALNVDPTARLVAMFDPFQDRLYERRKALRNVVGGQIDVDDDHCYTGFDGFQEMLASGIDVAILAEPPHFRPMHIEACVDAGVHILAEKPMAVDAPGVRRVLAAGEKARKKGISFVSGFETRYSTEARQSVEKIRDGAIGDIVAIQGIYNVGFLWHRGRQPDWTEMEYQIRNWYYFTWLSGDHIVEQFVHFMDKACWFLNERTPLSAWGYGGRQVRTDPKWGDIFDHHAVNFQYENGVRIFAYTRQQQGCDNEVSDTVLGTKGRLVHGGPRQRRKSGWRIEGETNWSPEVSEKHPEVSCFEEMFDGIRSGNPINDSFTMANSTMLAIHGRMATYSGKVITWEDAFNSQRVLAPKRYAWDADPPVMPDENGHYPVPIPGTTEVL